MTHRQMLICDPKLLLQLFGIFAIVVSYYALNAWGSIPDTDRDSSRYDAQIMGPMQRNEWVPESLPPAVQQLRRVADPTTHRLVLR
jgi:hypothetical protein